MTEKEGGKDMKKKQAPLISAGISLAASLTLAASLFAGQSAKKKDPPMVAPEGAIHPDVTASAGVVSSRTMQRSYVIGAEDVLSIDVWHEPEISQVEAVRSDGKITLPLIGAIRASGMTPGALSVEIQHKLSAYIQRPKVAVIIRQAKSQHFYIMGDVLRPGTYSLGSSMNVLDAIAVAGGFGEFANRSRIYVLRRLPNGNSERIRFNYKAAVQGKPRYLNLTLRPGDTIIVP
jgi:polysaccharide export outer membrane protein